MKINCIIVDDEELARKGLREILSTKKNIGVIKSCQDGLTAIEAIKSLKPELVLLDIQMPGINGFEVVASLPKPHPHVIFITAHDQYAVKAFEINAIDYLLKPFSDERFDQALNKAILTIKTTAIDENQSLENLINHTKESFKGSTKIVSGLSNTESVIFKSDGQIHKVNMDRISHIEAYDYYIKIHVLDQFFLIRESMKKIQDRLPNGMFLRIHKSYIVNLKMIKQFGKAKNSGHEVILQSGQVLKVSRNYKSELQKMLS